MLVSNALYHLAKLWLKRGDRKAAREIAEEALGIRRRVGTGVSEIESFLERLGPE